MKLARYIKNRLNAIGNQEYTLWQLREDIEKDLKTEISLSELIDLVNCITHPEIYRMVA